MTATHKGTQPPRVPEHDRLQSAAIMLMELEQTTSNRRNEACA
jgi:hypothetical protein